MTSFIPPCKWCGVNNSELFFENAKLCRTCYEKALRAAQNPQPCKSCSAIAVSETIFLQLISEDGYSHGSPHGLRIDAERGCGFCRMILLQDPNPNPRRLEGGFTVFAEGDLSKDGCRKDIKSLHFSSMPDFFRLTLAISAAPGIHPSVPILSTTLKVL